MLCKCPCHIRHNLWFEANRGQGKGRPRRLGRQSITRYNGENTIFKSSTEKEQKNFDMGTSIPETAKGANSK